MRKVLRLRRKGVARAEGDGKENRQVGEEIGEGRASKRQRCERNSGSGPALVDIRVQPSGEGGRVDVGGQRLSTPTTGNVAVEVVCDGSLANEEANVGGGKTVEVGGGVWVERGDMEDLRWEDVREMWGYDPHPIHGVRLCSEASFLIIQASVSGRVHTSDEEADEEHVTETADAPTPDTAAGDEDAVEPESPHRRWEERGTKKRRREELEGVENDDLAMDDLVEEVTVGQRFSIHFHHVMVRNATLAKLGLPMSAEDVAAELALAADHWVGLHAGCARGDVLPRCVKDNWGPESAVYEPDSETHRAVKEWLATHCSAEQMRPYVLGAGSWLNESFHSLICKYAPKRVRFSDYEVDTEPSRASLGQMKKRKRDGGRSRCGHALAWQRVQVDDNATGKRHQKRGSHSSQRANAGLVQDRVAAVALAYLIE
ncbi:unnamed protein product [Closterium sp. Naga37s-1]|nr:unnamed protein product [Closterium sp. Naga37s-1]